VGHYLFNFSKGQGARRGSLSEQAAASLRVKLWGVDAAEPHRDAIAPGDLILIYVAEPERAFIGRAELGSAVHEWTPSEARAYPGDSPSGVLLAHIEEWDPPVPMSAALPRIDPAGSNPYVQANAKAGFRSGVVRISAHEYESVLAVRAERLPSAG
jgi:EVE domain-containing protein